MDEILLSPSAESVVHLDACLDEISPETLEHETSCNLGSFLILLGNFKYEICRRGGLGCWIQKIIS